MLMRFLFLLILSNSLWSLQYKISNLELLEEISFSQAACINNCGDVAGNLINEDLRFMAFVWKRDYGLLILDTYSTAHPPFDLNDRNQLIGIIENGSDVRNFVWTKENGYFFLNNFHPNAINDFGFMVGMVYSNNWDNPKAAYISNNQGTILKKLNVWNSLNLSQQYIRKSKYVEFPIAINNRNEVVGTIRFHGAKNINNPGIYCHGFLWSDQNSVDFGNKIPVDINEESFVLLVSDFSEKGCSWIWHENQFTSLWSDGLAKAINDKGVVVGNRYDNAVIWIDGFVSELYEHILNPEGWEKLLIANDINNNGEIVGRGIYKGKQSAFILTPIK